MSEAQRILNNMASMPGYNAKVERRTAKEIMLHSPIFCQGYLREVKCKSVGAGVYDIRLSEKERP